MNPRAMGQAAARTDTDPSGELLSRRQLGKYLGVNERTVDRLRHRGLPAPFMVGASPRWRKTEIDTWLNRQREGGRA